MSATAATAAPAVAQTALGGSNGAATTVAAQFAAAPAAGSYLVAFVGTGDAAATITPPAGWTAAKDAAGHACRTTGATDTQGEQVYIHPVAAGETAGPIGFSFSSRNMQAVSLMEIRNVSATRPIDACTATVAGNSTGKVAATALNASAANELPVVGYVPSTSGLTVSPASGWTAKTYNNAQTQWMTLDAEYGPLTSAAGSVAPSTTFNAGGKTIVFAPAVALLFAPAAGNVVSAPSGTPAVAQTALAGSNGAATSMAAQLAAAPTAGSYLVAFVGSGDAAATIIPPAGWAAAKDAAGHACRTTGAQNSQGEQVFVHAVAAGEGAVPVSFSFSSSNMQAISLMEIRNVSATSPIDACSATVAGNSTGKVSATAVSAAAAGELPVVGYAPSTSGLTVSPASGWNAKTYNNPQTQWMTLDAEYGPLTSAAGSVAPSTTFNTGGTSIVFAPSVALLFAPAGANAAPSPSTAPTSAPTSVPTTTPTVAPTSAPSTIQNGVEWPTGFRPFGPSSPWNRPLTNTTSPRLLANSDAMVSLAESGGSDAQLFTSEYGVGTDYSHPVVVATASDPLVTPHCTVYCNPVYLTTPFHIPAKARPTSGSDHHLSIVQPDGTEIDMWLASRAAGAGDWQNGDTVNYGGGNTCGNFYTGSGFTANAATVGGACLGAGIVRAGELASGVIPHALFLVTACMDHSFVYPATQPGDYICSGAGPHVPNGAHVWLDLSDAAINALSINPWEKTILHALHQYGAFVGDTKGITPSHTDNLNQIRFESGAQFIPFGAASAMDTEAKSLGWNPVSISGATRYVGSDNWQPVNWQQHLHVVDPCYAQGTC
jgi:hypothetical protein